MKKVLTLLMILIISSATGLCQKYDIRVENQGEGGRYYVKVTALLDKKQNKEALDYLKKYAVEGVMLRGIGGANGYSSQKPLIEDPTVKDTHKEFFEAFNNEKKYLDYVVLDNESVSVTQLPKKKYEVSGLLLIDKERLLHFLEESGIIEGFGNLW